jgi:hypothetical protein
MAAPGAPYTLSRTVSVAVYKASGRPSLFYITDGSWAMTHASEHNAGIDVKDCLLGKTKP